MGASVVICNAVKDGTRGVFANEYLRGGVAFLRKNFSWAVGCHSHKDPSGHCLSHDCSQF